MFAVLIHTSHIRVFTSPHCSAVISKAINFSRPKLDKSAVSLGQKTHKVRGEFAVAIIAIQTH